MDAAVAATVRRLTRLLLVPVRSSCGVPQTEIGTTGIECSSIAPRVRDVGVEFKLVETVVTTIKLGADAAPAQLDALFTPTIPLPLHDCARKTLEYDVFGTLGQGNGFERLTAGGGLGAREQQKRDKGYETRKWTHEASAAEVRRSFALPTDVFALCMQIQSHVHDCHSYT